jgi:uncharacterized protein (DUF3820 family)
MEFQSEKLVVNWISFKFQHWENQTQIKIIDYLFKILFKSYQEFGKLGKPIKESILVSSKNKSKFIFGKEEPSLKTKWIIDLPREYFVIFQKRQNSKQIENFMLIFENIFLKN